MRYPASEKLEIIRLVEQSHSNIVPDRAYRYRAVQSGSMRSVPARGPQHLGVRSAAEVVGQALMTLLPAVFVDEKSPNFTAIRAICHGARKTETILAYSAAAVTLLARL